MALKMPLKQVGFCFLLIICLPDFAKAEYRVFELEITTFSEEPKNETPALANTTASSTKKAAPDEIDKKIVISNLDPKQYRGYNTVKPSQKIRYISTWRCPGRTNDKDYCPNPKVKTDIVSAAAPLETK